MHEFTVRFRSAREIQEFTAIAGQQNFPIRVGTERFQVNASSFMGIFALNCRKPLRVCAQCTQEEFEAFLTKIQPFLDN